MRTVSNSSSGNGIDSADPSMNSSGTPNEVARVWRAPSSLNRIDPDDPLDLLRPVIRQVMAGPHANLQYTALRLGYHLFPLLQDGFGPAGTRHESRHDLIAINPMISLPFCVRIIELSSPVSQSVMAAFRARHQR